MDEHAWAERSSILQVRFEWTGGWGGGKSGDQHDGVFETPKGNAPGPSMKMRRCWLPVLDWVG